MVSRAGGRFRKENLQEELGVYPVAALDIHIADQRQRQAEQRHDACNFNLTPANMQYNTELTEVAGALPP